MTDSRAGGTPQSNVVDNWEDAGDEVSVQLEQRQRQILKKKQKDEELAKARQTAVMQAQSCSSDEKPQSFKILRRPQSCGTLPTSSKSGVNKAVDQEKPSTRLKSLEEREAAYLQARERIFGGDYNPDEEPDPLAEVEAAAHPQVTAAGSPNPGAGPRMPVQHPAPVPRPRAPASFRAPRQPLFQPMQQAPGLGFTYYPAVTTHAGAVQVVQLPGSVPFYDARVPPPGQSGPVFAMPQVVYATADPYDSSYSPNPVPYGRPPAQLLSQPQFSAAYNASSNPNY